MLCGVVSLPSDAATDDAFGFLLPVSGDTAVIGALLDDDPLDNAGSAYVFVCGPSTCGDSFLDRGEECDDGNNDIGDGWAADCTVEEPVPAVSHRSMIAMFMLLPTITTAVHLRRRCSEA